MVIFTILTKSHTFNDSIYHHLNTNVQAPLSLHYLHQMHVANIFIPHSNEPLFANCDSRINPIWIFKFPLPLQCFVDSSLVMDSVLISVYLHLKARPQTSSLVIPFVEISDPRDDNGLLNYPLINGTCQQILWLSCRNIVISSNTTKAH